MECKLSNTYLITWKRMSHKMETSRRFDKYNGTNGNGSCTVLQRLEPVNIYLPLVLVGTLYLILLLITGLASKYQLVAVITQWITRFWRNIGSDASASSLLPEERQEAEIEPSSSTAKPSVRKGKCKRKATAATATSLSRNEPVSEDAGRSEPVVANEERKERLRCIDVFRGLSIFIMIFVDDGAGGYVFFEHSTWDGLYLADLAFPWFLWIMGVCIPISINSQLRKRIPTSSIIKKILIRSMKLFLLGLLIINTASKPGPVNPKNLRIPGVLQRFGICYFVGSLLHLFSLSGGESEESSGDSRFLSWRTLKSPSFQAWLLALSLVVTHTLLIFLTPVPGCPTGYFGPAGLHKNAAFPPSCVGGLTGYVDKLLLGENHTYKFPTAGKVYHSGSFDPEGILGILPSIFQVYLGVQAGSAFLSLGENRGKLLKFLLSSAFSCAFFSGVLVQFCGIPVNKNLWSLSYVSMTSSLGFLVLAGYYVVVDWKGWWSGWPLHQVGMNSILLYVGHIVMKSSLPWNFSLGRMNTHFLLLLENFWGLSVWVGVAHYLYERKSFYVV